MNWNPPYRIVTAFAEHAAGSGWSNQPVWVIIQLATGELIQECLQPEEQGKDIAILYETSAVISKAMKSLAIVAVEKNKHMRSRIEAATKRAYEKAVISKKEKKSVAQKKSKAH